MKQEHHSKSMGAHIAENLDYANDHLRKTFTLSNVQKRSATRPDVGYKELNVKKIHSTIEKHF